MTSYAFIDGAALLSFIEEAGRTLSPSEAPRIDYTKIFNHIAYSGWSNTFADRLFFYDAYPSKRNSENEGEFDTRWNETDALFKTLSRIPQVHVRTGVTTRHRKKVGVVQKGVDVLLAIEAFRHAQSGNIEEATLVLSDLDFLPLLDALTQTRVRTNLVYVPKKTNDLLIEAADYARPIGLKEFLLWCVDSEFRAQFNIEDAGIASSQTWQDKEVAIIPGYGEALFGKMSVTKGVSTFGVQAPRLLAQSTLVCQSKDMLIEHIERKAGAQLKVEKIKLQE
jgi:uncharacterized LabA/DUF88 family protein